MFLLDIVPLDDNRYKYQESTWIISGKAEPHMYGRYVDYQFKGKKLNFNRIFSCLVITFILTVHRPVLNG